jgi:hypothetical protein
MKVRENRKRADHSGSTFDGFLEQEGIGEVVEAVAIKRALAWQLEQAMQERQKTKRAWDAPAYRLPDRKDQEFGRGCRGYHRDRSYVFEVNS